MRTIELDCPPGMTRPWDLIVGVCKDTPLADKVTNEQVPCFFGESVWAFDIDDETWETVIQPVIKPRIEALYHGGFIRWGSW